MAIPGYVRSPDNVNSLKMELLQGLKSYIGQPDIKNDIEHAIKGASYTHLCVTLPFLTHLFDDRLPHQASTRREHPGG